MTRKCSHLLAAKDRAGLDVILFDCLDTLRANDADSAEIENILWLKIAVVSWDATKKMISGHALDFERIAETLGAALWQHFHIMQNLTYAIQRPNKF